MLKKIRSIKGLAGRVPTLFCGGDVQIDGVVDSTELYQAGLPGWLAKCQRVAASIGN